MDRASLLRRTGTLLLLLAVTPFVVYALPQLAGAHHSYVVLSSSMRPTIHAGDVVLVQERPPADIEAGDVVTFEPPAGHAAADAERVTHRVVEAVPREDGRYFRTKGDANEEPDAALVPATSVVGRVRLTIPTIGYAITAARGDSGIIAFVIVPAVLLALSEVWSLWRAASAPRTGEDPAPDDE